MTSRRSMGTVLEESNEGMLNSTGSSGNLLDRDASSGKKNKRYRVFIELLETEQNYVDVLNCIINDYKNDFDALDENERNLILNKHEQQILFAKIVHLLSLHKVILGHFENERSAWTGKNLIAYAFAQQKSDLLKYYVPYMNSYDEMIEILNRMQSDSHAQQFLKRCEARSAKKFTLKDLLIRPVQRLPSVTLLLRELLKVTPKSNPDHPCITMALETIDGVLSKSNDTRRDNDSYQRTLEVTNSIEQFPPELIASDRSFHAQADFQLIHSNGAAYKKYKGAVLTFFLFNDMVVVAKRRERIKEVFYPKQQSRLSITHSLNTSVTDLSRTLSRSGSMSTLKRSLSFISGMSRMERKPFKYRETLRFASFRQFMYIRQDCLFFLNLRDEMSDEMTTLRIAGETNMDLAEDFMEKLCIMIKTTANRDMTLVEISNMLAPDAQSTSIHSDDLEYAKKMRSALPRSRKFSSNAPL